MMAKNSLPANATVITIDDGWYATKIWAHKILRENAFPYTIYVTSYYSKKETPIFNMTVQYLFWKGKNCRLDLKNLNIGLEGKFNISDNSKSNRLMNNIIDYGQKKLTNDERINLARRLAGALNIQFGDLVHSRILNLLTASEISDLSQKGVDIQLHTHRHRWPLERGDAEIEIAENRSYLEPLVGKHLTHFCYPSGIWHLTQLPFLESADIASATTCDTGINYPGTNILALKRIVDNEVKSQLEFEAELCGFMSFLRTIRYLFKKDEK
jgi:peptidoglycan/xylan/chitin deacetylase (PgdA/CDA1 family)